MASGRQDGGRTRGAACLLIGAIVLVALNQRPAVVAVSPLLADLRAGTGLSSALSGLLTTVPVLCFGAFAPFAPRLARRIGLETAVAASLVLLAAGIALRLLQPVALLYAGAFIAGAAIAIANVLMPAYVKREFVRPGAVMGLYSAALDVGAAAAAAFTVPIGVALGLSWRGALASWLALAVLATGLWLAVVGAYVVGLGGLLLLPASGTLVWVAFSGLAQGSGFALALTLIVLRSATPLVSARLGGVAQCLGYLVAAAGPFALGVLHDVTGSWPVVVLLVLLVPMLWTGWGAARDAVLDAPSSVDQGGAPASVLPHQR